VQSQPIPALHAHYAPHQTTDQTLRVQIRRDHRRPSFHAPKRAPRRICPFANALHALPRASMVIHALPRVGRSSHAPALSGSTSHALWNLLAREIHAPYQSLANETHAPTRLLARELHALLAATGFARASHAPGVLPRPRAYWRVRCTRPCSQHTLARALHAPGAPHHYPAATCLSESRHVSPSSATCQASQKKKKLIRIQYFRPDPTG
jgi:hypothetical protein